MQADNTQMIDSSSGANMGGNAAMDNRDPQILPKVEYFCGRK